MKRMLLMLQCVLFAAAVPAAEPSTLEQGATVLAPFKRDLMAALTEGMTRGPANALDVCQLQAPALALAASSPAVTVGRTSHKVRNPGNEPRDWVRPLLADYVANPDAKTPRAIDLPGGARGYVEPIYVQPMCLACHGESIAPAVKEQIATLYPTDQATGFGVGDFRGLFWVEFSASGTSPAP